MDGTDERIRQKREGYLVAGINIADLDKAISYAQFLANRHDMKITVLEHGRYEQEIRVISKEESNLSF